ncbi:MAG: hypothetical protein ABIH21_05205 [Patescibacteria group bacterium]
MIFKKLLRFLSKPLVLIALAIACFVGTWFLWKTTGLVYAICSGAGGVILLIIALEVVNTRLRNQTGSKKPGESEYIFGYKGSPPEFDPHNY